MQPKILNQRYEIESKVGDGGMATVYRGRDTRLNRVVAIKVLHAHHANDINFLQRFSHEAQAAANLRHPSIVDIYDVGQEDRQHFIVMEFVEGPDLKTMILRKRQLPIEQVLTIGAAIADGLDTAHNLGMVHRDVKPQNILVTQDGTAKITDFGIAKSGLSTALTETGVTFGTADYISPEQAKGQPATAQSDIYALGVTIYEALTGQLPFTGESAVAVAMQHVSSKPPPIRRHNPNVSAALEQLILRALAKNPADRPASAREFANLLRAQEESEVRITAPHGVRSGPLRPPSQTGPLANTMRSLPPKRSTITSPMPTRAGREFGGFIILLMLLTLAVALVYLLLMGPLKGLMSSLTPAPVTASAPQPRASVLQSASLTVVPDLTGYDEAALRDLTTTTGLIVVADAPQASATVSAGLVISQAPAADSPIPADKTIHYVLSSGSTALVVPADVNGRPVAEVEAQFAELGLRTIVVEQSDATVAAGTVIRTDPVAGAGVQPGDTIQIVASTGSNRRVPDVTGVTEADAQAIIRGARLVVGTSVYQGCDVLGNICDTIDPGIVVHTEPAVGAFVADGTSITLIVRTP
jgi:serine/threonine-protein kinase